MTHARVESEELSLRGLSVHVRRVSPAREPRARVVLVHGFQDAAGSFDPLALAIAADGYEVLSYDQRGFGRTSWISSDGYYHFPDYVADLDTLLASLSPSPVVLVGHSMGGTVVTLFAAARPERVSALVLLEGVGPPHVEAEHAVERMRLWLDDLAAAPREHKPMASRSEAVRRLLSRSPQVPAHVLEQAVGHLVTGDEGAVRWAFDPLHRTHSPAPFDAARFRLFLKALRCPVLWVSGGEAGFHPADEAERLACIADLERVGLEGAGHMLHWTRGDDVAASVLDFLARRLPRSS